MDFDLLCKESIQNIQENNSKLNEVKDNPEKILTDIYNGNGSYNSLTKTIETFGDKCTIHDFQKYLYDLLIPLLKEKLGNEYSFRYNIYAYPSSITIGFQDYDLVFISIQNQTLTILNSLHIETHKKDLRMLKKALENNKVLLKKIEDAGMNPFKLCEGNIIGFFCVLLRFNKIRNNREHLINDLKREIELYEKEVNELEQKIIKEESIKKDIEVYTQKLINFFKEYSYETKIFH